MRRRTNATIWRFREKLGRAGPGEALYDAARMRHHLDARGIASGILKRASRHHPLTRQETARNHLLSLKRRAVEAVFGTLKRSYGFHRMRYFSACP